MIQAWLDCTKKAEQELPVPEGEEHADEENIKRAADVGSDRGCGLVGCGLWVVGCGLWVVGCRLKS